MLAGLIGAVTPGAVGSVVAAPLQDDEIKALVTDATVHLDTPLGTTLPIAFDNSGRVSGTAGKLEFYLQAPRDRGRWWVRDNKLCQKWFRWFDAKVNCLTLTKVGEKYAWVRDDGTKGTASVEPKPQPPPTLLTKAATVVAQIADAITPEPPGPRGLGAGSVAASGAVAPASVELVAPPPTPAVVMAVTVPTPKITPAVQPVPVVFVPAVDGRTRGILYRVVNVRADDTLNIRREPNSLADVVGKVPAGARGLVMLGDCRGEWCPMGYTASTGWVHRAFVELVPMMDAPAR